MSSRIAEYQQPLGRALIDAGADIIFGNHVHAVQGIEQYKGKAILYSPGTFIGRQLPPESEGGEISDLVRTLLADMSPDGFITLVDIDDAGSYDLRIIPTSLDSRGLPVVVSADAFERIAQRIEDWSAKMDTTIEREDGELRLRKGKS
jgi:poly-gamma-glutamate capsule biosynthesis protein CapA/YwtB (metallophosphatase superfamily)